MVAILSRGWGLGLKAFVKHPFESVGFHRRQVGSRQTRSVTSMELDTVRRLYLHKFDTCSVLCFEHFNTFKHVITPYARKS